MKKLMPLLLLAVVAVTGCSEGKKTAPEKTVEVPEASYHIKCWSGGVVIYDGYSNRWGISVTSGGLFDFRDKADGKRKSVSGDCVAER